MANGGQVLDDGAFCGECRLGWAGRGGEKVSGLEKGQSSNLVLEGGRRKYEMGEKAYRQ